MKEPQFTFFLTVFAVVFAGFYFWFMYQVAIYPVRMFWRKRSELIDSFERVGVLDADAIIIRNLAEPAWDGLCHDVDKAVFYRAKTVAKSTFFYGGLATIMTTFLYHVVNQIYLGSIPIAIWMVIIIQLCVLIFFFMFHLYRFESYAEIGTRKDFYEALGITEE